jgi:hypothetical protein
MPDLGLAPFAVRHAHGPVPVGHLTVRIHLTVRYPLGIELLPPAAQG